MKSNVFHLSNVMKKIHRSKGYQYHTHWRKGLLQLLLLKVCRSFLFGQVNERGILWSVGIFFAFLEVS